MRFLLVIFFFMLFMGIVLYSYKSINKFKKENKDAERELENERRQRLEMENTEFDYGHNRIENKEYYGG